MKSLEEIAKELSAEVSKHPGIYLKFLYVLNTVALAVGWVRSIFRK